MNTRSQKSEDQDLNVYRREKLQISHHVTLSNFNGNFVAVVLKYER